MSAIDELLEANKRYAAKFDKGDLPSPPAKHVAVLTCMDSRIHIDKILELQIGDSHIIRNAGGRATDDAVRSLIISIWLLGVNEIMVIQHTDCGMLKHTNAEIQDILRQGTGADASSIDFLPFTDLEASVRDGVSRIRNCPFISWEIDVRGFVYDVKTGALKTVESRSGASA
jgi:carbonic anhydrase